MSTSRSSAVSGPSKKISSWVRPGVCEVRASALRPVSALIRLDLPTLERPANATSMPAIGGSASIEGEAQKNCQSPANSFRPCSINFASMAVVMRRLPLEAQSQPSRHCERSEAIQLKTLGKSGCFVAALLAMTRRATVPRLRRLLPGEGGPEIVEQFNLYAVAAHDVALLRHRQQIVPGPVNHQTRREPGEHEGEDQRHPVEDHLLRRIRRRRIEL